LQAKSCILLVLLCLQSKLLIMAAASSTTQGLAQWQHPVASSEAQDGLHWAMCPALYRSIRMVIKIASKVGVFFASLILLSSTI
jgi:hypothetical protein